MENWSLGSAQVLPVNANVAVSILSNGSNKGSVSQQNNSSADSAAVYLAQTVQSVIG